MEYMYLHYFTTDPVFPFFIHYGEHDTDMPVHFHADFSELVMVLNGSASHCVDAEEYPISKGDVFVINGNTSHGYKSVDHLRICNIMYRAQDLHRDGRDLRKSAGYQALFVVEPFLAKEYRFESRLRLSLKDYETLRHLIDSMIGEFNGRTEGYQTLVHARFLELVVFLSRRYTQMEDANPESLIHIARAVSYMESHFQHAISLADIAAQANLSPRHFSRLFNQSHATSPMHHLLNLRLQHACELLKKSGLGISEIAWQSGFEDSNYFARQFHKVMGCSPREYRADHGASRKSPGGTRSTSPHPPQGGITSI